MALTFDRSEDNLGSEGLGILVRFRKRRVTIPHGRGSSYQSTTSAQALLCRCVLLALCVTSVALIDKQSRSTPNLLDS